MGLNDNDTSVFLMGPYMKKNCQNCNLRNKFMSFNNFSIKFETRMVSKVDLEDRFCQKNIFSKSAHDKMKSKDTDHQDF